LSSEAVLAIIIACIGAGAGILPLLKPRPDTSGEIVKAAESLIKPLREELECVRKENADLSKQVEILMQKNIYTADLEGVRDELQEKVTSMQGRIETLERMNKHLIEAFREYISNPVDKTKFSSMLDDMERQI